MHQNKILIINGHQKYEGISEGNLNSAFVKAADEFLRDNGCEIAHTHPENSYDVSEELEKLVWADKILFQCPIYWFSVPWITKKYFDEVWSGGYTTVTCSGDGRTREDPTKRYGSGGLMDDMSYMLSLTYACPDFEFDDEDGFYDGQSIDEANIAIHKTFEFCGLKRTQTYAIYNVHKEQDLHLEDELKKFKELLQSNFLQ